MAKYDISKQALEDLYKIWEYTVDTWSETQADKYYKLLENAMNEIGTSPQETGKPYDEIMTGLKGYHAGKHLIFYIIQDNGRAFIARILHENARVTRWRITGRRDERASRCNWLHCMSGSPVHLSENYMNYPEYNSSHNSNKSHRKRSHSIG